MIEIPRWTQDDSYELEVEVALGVVVGDVLDHLVDEVHLRDGELAEGEVAAEDIAQDPAEILVTRVADKAARVGEHAHEAAQKAEVGERVHLAAHADFLVEEPPAGAELHLAGDRAVIVGIGHGHHHCIVLGVKAVEDGLGELALAGETVEETVAGSGDIQVMDGIVAGVGTDLGEHLGVVVADGADMELLGPSRLGIHHRLVEEEGTAELLEILGAWGDAEQYLLEDELNLHLLVIG